MSNLAETLRPQKIGDLIGQEHVKRAVKSFAERGSWPSVWLLYGPPGTGKTTVAKIVAAQIQPDPAYIHEINASANNKVDDIRAMEERAYGRPFNGQPQVFICNEADRYTPDAQQAAKDMLEMSGSVFLLTSNNPEKINDAIKSRASAATFKFGPLTDEQVVELLGRVSPRMAEQGVGRWLAERDIRLPREIIGFAEQALTGISLEQCVHSSEHEPLYAEVAKATLDANWSRAADLLKKIKTCDSRAMVTVVSSKLRWEALSTPPGAKLDALSACLVGLDALGYAEGVAYGAVTGLIAKCCKALAK